MKKYVKNNIINNVSNSKPDYNSSCIKNKLIKIKLLKINERNKNIFKEKSDFLCSNTNLSNTCLSLIYDNTKELTKNNSEKYIPKNINYNKLKRNIFLPKLSERMKSVKTRSDRENTGFKLLGKNIFRNKYAYINKTNLSQNDIKFYKQTYAFSNFHLIPKFFKAENKGYNNLNNKEYLKHISIPLIKLDKKV